MYYIMLLSIICSKGVYWPKRSNGFSETENLESLVVVLQGSLTMDIQYDYEYYSPTDIISKIVI